MSHAEDKNEKSGRQDGEQNYMDTVQESTQETGEGPGGEEMALGRNQTGFGSAPDDQQKGTEQQEAEDLARQNEVQLDVDVANQDAPEEVAREAKSTKVIFVAHEDFDARINQQDYTFVKDVPTRVDRGQAAEYVDQKRGYIKE